MEQLLDQVTAVVVQAGAHLLDGYATTARPANKADMARAGRRLDEWAVTVASVKDNVPVPAVVHQPIGNRTWTATRGGGAFRNGEPLTVPAKTELSAAIVTMTQPRTLALLQAGEVH
jgi:hypothetical protein